MELTPEILKSVESTYYTAYSHNNETMYVLRYKGMIVRTPGGVRLFKNIGSAKKLINTFVQQMFHHGEYWHEYRENTKKRTGKDIDFSGTIAIIPSYGLTSKWDKPEIKKIIKDIASELLEQGIFTIEEFK